MWAARAALKFEPHRRSPTENRCPPRASVRQKSMHFRSINRCFRRSPNSVLPNDVSKRRTAALGGHQEFSRAHAHGAKSGFENSRRHRARAASTSKVAPGPPPRAHEHAICPKLAEKRPYSSSQRTRYDEIKGTDLELSNHPSSAIRLRNRLQCDGRTTTNIFVFLSRFGTSAAKPPLQG